PKSLKYPLKIQNKGIYNLSKSWDKVFLKRSVLFL
ncbi:hypothetical protein V066_02641, partial [Staphylococcus aureus R0615]